MAIVRVNPNLESELTGSLSSGGPLERTLGDVADQIARRAQQIGRTEFYRRGGYVRGIKAEHGLNEHGELVGRVVATDWKSHWAERGWGNRAGGRRARHILARAAQQTGFQVVARQAFGGGRVPARQIASRSRMAITGR
jgi:hypothetical protein